MGPQQARTVVLHPATRMKLNVGLGGLLSPLYCTIVYPWYGLGQPAMANLGPDSVPSMLLQNLARVGAKRHVKATTTLSNVIIAMASVVVATVCRCHCGCCARTRLSVPETPSQPAPALLCSHSAAQVQLQIPELAYWFQTHIPFC